MKKESKATPSSSKKHSHPQHNDFRTSLVNQQAEEKASALKKEKEEFELRQSLENEIREYEEKIKCERDLRTNVVEVKRQDIERKEQTVNQMRLTNEKLQSELESLRVDVQKGLDQVEYKDKHQQYEAEKLKKEDPLKHIVKVKEKELNNSMLMIESYKKEKDKFELKLKEKIDLVQVNSLNDQIKLANERVKDLEREVVFLQKIKSEHQNCVKAKEKLGLEINVIKRNIQLQKMNQRELLRAKGLSNSLEWTKQEPELRKKSQERIEREMKQNLEDFWLENNQVIAQSHHNKDPLKSTRLDYNDSNRVMITNINPIKAKPKVNLKMSKIFPPIGLFNSDEKKVLLNVLPLQEIEKFERRYESLDITKSNMERRFALETRLLNKENKELEDKYQNSNAKLKENEEKNRTLMNQIAEQREELGGLKVKLNGLMKQLEDVNAKSKEKEEMNRKLALELQLIQKEYTEDNKQRLLDDI